VRRMILPALVMAVVMVLSVAAVAAVPGIVNVKDYGAKGDGVTDDTAAIRAAVNAAAIRRSEPSPVGLYIQSGPALVFPQGKYIVSDQFDISSLIEIRGEGRPIIRQSDSSKNIFTSTYAWRIAIRNISFSGGKNQIDLYNPNVDSGHIVIDDCRFYGATGFGVKNQVVSTTVDISDCTFVRCHQAWCNMSSDQLVMRDCWIQASASMGDYAVIENHSGMMTIENVVFVSDVINNPKQRWIDNRAEWLTVRKCRFGSENGGFTPIYQYVKYTSSLCSTIPPALGDTLVMDDCFVSASGTPAANCAIYCYEVPNLLKIRKTTFCGSQAVVVDPAINLANYFYVNTAAILGYSIRECIGESTIQLPSGLASPVIHIL
jgi:hypothetical protein